MGEYDNTLGTLLIGIFFNTYLYGLATYQFAAYCRRGSTELLYVKATLWLLFILDTFHSGAAIYMAWSYTVTNYDNPAALAVAAWPYTLTPIGTAATALVTQLFNGYRIWCLRKRHLLFSVVVALAIPSFALGMACGIKAWTIQVLAKLPQLNNLVIAWHAFQVSTDVFITGALTINFLRLKKEDHKTNAMLNRLTLGAIQAGLFAVIFALGDLVSFLALPTTNLCAMFAIPTGRIYTNTLFGTLLTRDTLQQMMDTSQRKSEDEIEWAHSDSAKTGYEPDIEQNTTTDASPLEVSKIVLTEGPSFVADGPVEGSAPGGRLV